MYRQWILVLLCCIIESQTFFNAEPSVLPQGFLEHHVALERQKRYLLYPDGDPARVQLIIGLGVPVDLEDQSVTIGYVIKILYHIPQVAEDYTTHMFNSATILRSFGGQQMVVHDNSTDADDVVSPKRVVRRARGDNDTTPEENANLINSRGRYEDGIMYSEGGVIRDKGNNEKYERHFEDVGGKERMEESRKLPETSRWDVYKILEYMMERNGFNGRSCMLKTICEASNTPFTAKNGLLGELMHIIFTPSTTAETVSHHSDHDYHKAEFLGRSEDDCEAQFPDCEESLLDLFSEVGFEAMFG